MGCGQPSMFSVIPFERKRYVREDQASYSTKAWAVSEDAKSVLRRWLCSLSNLLLWIHDGSEQ